MPDRGAGHRVEELVGLDAVRDALDRLSHQAREEVLAFAPADAQTTAALAVSAPLNDRLLQRGVRMRTIYLCSARNDPVTVNHVRRLIEGGAQVRTAPRLPLRVLVIDRRVAVVPLDPSNTAAGACVLHGTGMAATACALFDQYWGLAMPWDALLTPREIEVARCVSEGLTNKQVGHRLAISEWTVINHMREIMRKLECSSRVQVARRLWF